jgi:hypothetical protein
MPASWGISMEQAAELLRHRCEQIAFDRDLDAPGLRDGAPDACLPILRFAFVNFSEALSEFLLSVGHVFEAEMGDAELVARILDAWPLISPHRALGGATVPKVLKAGMWGADRLLFTLQAVLVCSQKHRELVALTEQEWLRSGVSWTDTTPQQQFADHPLCGTEEEDMRSTVAWMAEAYREQLQTLDGAAGAGGAGAAEQQKWLDALRGAADPVGGSLGSTASTLYGGGESGELDGRTSRLGTRPAAAEATLLGEEEVGIYAAQLQRVELGALCEGGGADGKPGGKARAEAEAYRKGMEQLSFGTNGGLEEDDGFDDQMLCTPFIAMSAEGAATRSVGRERA